MYTDYFGLKELPFSIAPDPRYLYMSERHREALAHLLYGVNGQGGFVVLTGEVGTGKTTICRCFLNQIPKNTNVAFVVNPKLTALELMETICDEFEIDYPQNPSIRILTNLINRYLLKSHSDGEHTVLIIDEAQNLEIDVLEQLRLLTNLETSEKKLLQIVLLGQPELREILGRNELRQLAQRITARYHLDSLSRIEVGAYLKCRLSVAGQKKRLFNQEAIKKLFKYSGGVPRLINLLADRSLLGAYAEHAEGVGPHHVEHANRELKGEAEKNPHQQVRPYLAGGAMLLLLVFGFLIWNSLRDVTPIKPQVDVAVSSDVKKDPAGKTVTIEPQSTSPDRDIQPPEIPGAAPAEASLVKEESGFTKKRTGIQPAAIPSKAQRDPAAIPDEYSPFVRSVARMNPTKNNKYQAFKAILATWNVDYPEEPFKLACDRADEAGLSCLHKQGNWRRLMQLNRPAVLKLINDYGKELNVALLRLDGEYAKIQVGGRSFWTYRDGLDALWYGNFSIIWRLPPYKSRIIYPGAVNDENKWLASRLDNIRTRFAADLTGDNKSIQQYELPGKSVDLSARISWFQQKVGLFPDGIAGALTLIQINNYSDVDHPLLLSQLERAN